jgi:hypothetical protein
MSCPRPAVIGLTLVAAACCARQPVTAPNEAIIYVIERGWHTDIGLPVDVIAGPMTSLEDDFPGVRFLTFGFGERQFVVDRKKSFGAMLRALLPSRSALLLTGLKDPPQAAFGAANVVVLQISRAGLSQIEAKIWHEFDLSSDGSPVFLADGPYDGGLFYAGRDTYFGLFTCNTWTAETLQAGGFAVPAAGVLFAGQVMGPARWIGAHQTASPQN